MSRKKSKDGRRHKLRLLGAQERHQFTAYVDGFSMMKGGWSETAETLLVTDVRCRGEVVTDHLWFKRGKWAEALEPGMVISFFARVGKYKKTSRKSNAARRHGGKRKWEVDWHLLRPTKITVIDDGSEAGERHQEGKRNVSETDDP